jgi:hypothetical protein
MNFQRGGDIKETLKVGRKANAVKVKSFEIVGEVIATLDPSSITKEMIIKYKIENNNKLKFRENFFISQMALETALIILNRDGICRDFNDYVIELISKNFLKSQWVAKRDLHIDKNVDLIPKVKWVLVVSEENVDLPKSIREKFQLTFDRTGLDLLYKDQLYRIAPPKDGGLKDE